MKLDITTPDDYVGEIVGDLQQRRAIIEATESRGALTGITAFAPLKELFWLLIGLRSLSQGRAGCSMEPTDSNQPSRDVESFSFG